MPPQVLLILLGLILTILGAWQWDPRRLVPILRFVLEICQLVRGGSDLIKKSRREVHIEHKVTQVNRQYA
jgi:hypothetical protein